MSKDEDTSLGLPLEDAGLTKAEPANAPRTAGRSRLLLIPLLLGTLFTGAVIGMYFQPPGLRAFFNTTGLEPGAGTDTPIAVAIQQVVDQEQIAVISEGDVVALGRIIPRGDVISVATPSGGADARIAQLQVAVGDDVEAGDILAVLDNLTQLESAVASAQAEVRVREATLAQTRASNTASQAEAQASLERAEASATVAQSELDRVTTLFERGVITRASFDQTVATATQAARDVERAKATLSRYETGSETVQADIAVAEANLAAARATLVASQTDLDSAYVRAPERGRILDINVRPGERPGTEGIIDLGDTSQMTVEAEVYQTMIGRVTIGDPAIIQADALAQDLIGTVSAIGLEIGRQSITSDDPAANTDARVVSVIITLDADSSPIAAPFTNLEAIVRIDAGRTP
ncbi:HlyD family efflux transporter periplasmic adaptor subunit [Octadecabacter sp. CECT 8868]|uniref:HlyD family efflux transporter periplasmic adaptor subunit n=1 Tax=Octadecabacter algicola TaxID=2909342 RepID=UPI001F303776|nr:HlyD family efflux transporter periplasmic adaptor subunit [Octadecabacter algicola]MCF2904945.1 HlyD family efflux transporter periplasmic adaptor subunit [Octadecabacter algicola]